MATDYGTPVPTFATAHDLTINLGTERQSIAIERATDLIRAELDQQLTPHVTDDVVTLYGRGRRLIQLPELPVTKVTSVTVNGVAWTEGTHYRVDLENGVLERMYHPWPYNWPIVVIYDHGYDHLPPQLTRVAAAIADKIIDGTVELRQKSETWGDRNVSQTFARATDTMLSQEERKILDKYRPVKLP